MPVVAVIFDMDGVLIDSEPVWASVREELAREHGAGWHDRAHEDMMGMSSPEWTRYMHERLGVPMPPMDISREVVKRLSARYRERLPLLPEAREAVGRLSAHWPLGLASSSNRELIDLVLALTGLSGDFRATVSSEEVARGKPAPDVFLEAARRLGFDPSECAAIEDSRSGIQAAAAAGMRVVAVPRPDYAPGPDVLSLADSVLPSLAELNVNIFTGSMRA